MGLRLEGVRLYSSLLPVSESRLEPLPPLELATRGRQRRLAEGATGQVERQQHSFQSCRLMHLCETILANIAEQRQ